ncbi:MAG TPA: hypothetical protein V6D17_15360, partial [Candidatus Obscuribacterales bacterium]
MTTDNNSQSKENASSDPPDLAALVAEFEKAFPTDLECAIDMHRRGIDSGALKCRHCGSKETKLQNEGRVMKCDLCLKPTWIFADSVFHGARKLRAWYAVIWLMDKGQQLNSHQLSERFGIAYDSAWHIMQKLAGVIDLNMAYDPAWPSSLFSSIFRRRSRETPAGEHPVKEQERCERNKMRQTDTVDDSDFGSRDPQGACTSTQPNEHTQSENNDEGTTTATHNANPATDTNDKLASAPLFSEDEQKVYAFIGNDPIHFETIRVLSDIQTGELSALLTMLELAGVVIRQPGDYYIRRTQRPALQLESGNGQFSGDISPVRDFMEFAEKI